METPKIYESPDGGKTIYARDFGAPPNFRVLIKSPEKRVVLVTGGFDPLHSGHLAYFKAAKALGDTLVVGINSDSWLKRKKGRSFYTWNERFQLIKNLEMVDYVIEFNDDEISNGIHHHHDAVNKERQQILGEDFSVGDGIFVLDDNEKDKIPFSKKELDIIKPSYTTHHRRKLCQTRHLLKFVMNY